MDIVIHFTSISFEIDFHNECQNNNQSSSSNSKFISKQSEKKTIPSTDDFPSKTANVTFPSDRHHSNTHTNPTFRDQNRHQHSEYNHTKVRQGSTSNDGSYVPEQYNPYGTGHTYSQQRTARRHRPTSMSNQRGHRMNGNVNAARDAFQDNVQNYDADFDFETSNRTFNKLASADEFKQQTDSTGHFDHRQFINKNNETTTDYALLHDKKKSFFDNTTVKHTSNGSKTSANHRTNNMTTFGYDGQVQRLNARPVVNTHRRANNYYRQQQSYDYSYQQSINTNGYQYHF
jgi:hypothetical protein